MKPTFYKIANLFLLTFCLLKPAFSADSNAANIVLTNDGREVQLNSDGSWHYLSTDRLVTTIDGTQIRLKDDGSWQAVGNAPLKSKQQVRTSALDIQLIQVVVERSEKKVQKNTRVKTQTVFHLTLKNSAQEKQALSLNNELIDGIKVSDDNGKQYTVLSLQSGSNTLLPGETTALTVRCKKSPSILEDIKSMQLRFNKGVFGLTTPITLSQKIVDFKKRDVDKL